MVKFSTSWRYVCISAINLGVNHKICHAPPFKHDKLVRQRCEMPIYEYQCSACGHQLEEIQKISDKPLTDCPKCGQLTLTKLVSAAGFQLKGSGWYLTDYSAKGKSKSTNESAGQSSSESGN